METAFTSVGIFALLGLGLLFGLKHATEVDHVVAVSTIVSEHRSRTCTLLMSGVIGLPFALSGRRLTSINYGLQTAAGGLGVAFELWYAYETAFINSLWRTIL